MSKERKSRKKRPIQYYASTLFLVVVLVALEIAILAVHILWVSQAISIANLGLRLLSFLVILYIVNQDESNAYKLAWCIPILIIPLVGGIAYIISQTRGYHRVAKKHITKTDKAILAEMPPCNTTDISDLQGNENLYRYLQSNSFTAYKGDDVRYYAMGEEVYTDLLSDLKNAKSFIFMEYFIIHEGVMWDSILTVLKEKASSGVDVRILYDGMGCIRTLPRNYQKTLASYGIKAKVFSPFIPVLSTLQNNRDHRKITVIDGEIAYTGGINLADEYINEINRYGVWKDSAIRMQGNAANSFTRFFLTQWNIRKPQKEEDLKKHFPVSLSQTSNVTVIPYADSPLDDQTLGKDVYLHIIHSAKRYLYISTPYLVPGAEIMNALKLAAESGVDVRIVTPSVSDNKIVHKVTRSKYESLIRSGVKIYEYTPGFIHAKNVVCDDTVSTCGSVNFDYRSLYLHFECGSVIYGEKTAKEIKRDFEQTFTKSHMITLSESKKRSLWAYDLSQGQ